MPTHNIKDQYNKKLVKMADLCNKKPSAVLEEIIDEHYVKFLKDIKSIGR